MPPFPVQSCAHARLDKGAAVVKRVGTIGKGTVPGQGVLSNYKGIGQPATPGAVQGRFSE